MSTERLQASGFRLREGFSLLARGSVGRRDRLASHQPPATPAAPVLAAVIVALAVVTGGCGGTAPEPATTSPGATAAQAGADVTETRWLRGLWANDIRQALGTAGLTCAGPVLENRFSVWSCESGTPLVSYKTRFYGTAPGKIEYITAMVTQTERPKDDLALRLFVALAGLHFEGSDPAKARTWVRDSVAKGGSTAFGPAKFKLQGDERRRQFDIKASGSEW